MARSTGLPQEQEGPGGPLPAYSLAIVEARQRLKWSQSYLGERLGRSQQTINSWESGARVPAPELWGKICDELGLSPSVFFQGRSRVNDPEHGLERLIDRERQNLFTNLYNGLVDDVRDLHVLMSPATFAYLLHNLWTRALLLDDPPTLEERVNMLRRRQREIWKIRRDP